MDLAKILTEKIKNKQSRIGIVGLGYVGVPLALRFLDTGFQVVGYDVDVDKIRALTSGKRYFTHIDPMPIKKYVAAQRLEIYSDPDALSCCDAILICVPTPLTNSRDPDMGYIQQACGCISGVLRAGQLIILESTTYPGTTEQVVVSILHQNESGYEAGVDFFVAFSPEREDPGNRTFSVKNTPKIVGGLTEQCRDLAVLLYSQIVDKVVPVSSCAVAEMTKILENTYRAVNIALINELKMVCHKLGIDIWEVVKAASTKPYGFQPFYPGLGWGGHCIACDPHYLSWRARQAEMPTRFIDLAGDVNWEMPRYVAKRVQDELNARGRPVKGSQILVLGVAYKKNIGDTRESPALKLIKELQQLGATVVYHDPYVPVVEELRYVDPKPDCVENMDCIVAAVAHDKVDYVGIHEAARLIVDTCNVFPKSSKKVVQA